MGIKSNFCMAIGSLVVFFNAALASPMYSIDPNQSYIQIYTQSWVQSPSPWFFGEGIPWISVWNPTTYALSGSFDGTTQLSPWAPGVGHLAISQQNFTASAPIPIAFNLPSLLTFDQVSGDIIASNQGGFPCALDPFYGPPPPGWSCLGFTSGFFFSPSLSGTFDGSILNIQGGSGGFLWGPTLFPFIGFSDLPPPPAIDPYNFNYRIVAHAVPEPDSSLLALLGIAVLGVSRRKRT